ncbi:holo-ACP synthase [Loigolactobacillus jiayinensis]|uniref:Holo-[acyl-carrier-protein] synthase n=1 Tax=Loigolactobacillus jiayinensis TaxID=2486016 RepID=A0ABW1RF23_9LACO|nr:holo-ACP synthase [Loigolactobacillus jiayinensis]
MIFGIGVDITDIARIKAAQAKNTHFKARVLTAAELAVYANLAPKRQAEYLTGRFSVKESFGKALGTGIGRVGFLDIEVLDDELGKPVVTKNPFAGRALVSISHTDTMVMSEVILERGTD